MGDGRGPGQVLRGSGEPALDQVRGTPGPAGVVGARGELKHPADRLGSVSIEVFVDERAHHLDGRSSSAAKKAEAWRRGVFARRNSPTLRSRSVSRVASSVVVPRRSPWTVSPRWTQFRSASGLIPSCSPMRR